MSDFSKAIEAAQDLPEIPEDLEGVLPDPFKASESSDGLITRSTEEDGVPNVAKYDYSYQCARFIVGQVQMGFSHGQAEYEDKDDSKELKDIMDQTYNAKAILIKKETTFLKDGTVVIWVEWAEPKKPEPKKGTDPLSYAELMSPEPTKSRDSTDSGDT